MFFADSYCKSAYKAQKHSVYHDEVLRSQKNKLSLFSTTLIQFVLVVGYGTEKNRLGVPTDYWLVQSNWGPTFGENGYFKILRGKKLCKIATDMYSPVIKANDPVNLVPIKTPSVCIKGGDVIIGESIRKSFCIIERVIIFMKMYSHVN